MSLRVRLSVAFFALLLGPLAAGVVAVVGALARPAWTGPATDAPTIGDGGFHASRAVRDVVAVHCHQLRVAAASLAMSAGLRGLSYVVTENAPPGPWAVCGVDPATLDGPVSGDFAGLAARAEIRGADDEIIGYAFAVVAVDARFLDALSAAAGAGVVPRRGRPAGSVPLLASADQPLLLAVVAAPPGSAPTPGVWVIAIAAGVAGVLLAAWLGWWLGGLATRPLRELVGTVRQVTAGDLSARSNLSGRDETGRLAAGLDRLIAGMQETQRLSVTDALTGLGNLRHLTESLHVEIERAARFNRALGLLLIDLDHFKVINDQHGHRAGDEVLVEFARRVRRSIREVDLAFRQGGEEFVILLPETDVPGSLTAARRINEAVRDVAFPAVTSGEVTGWLPVTVSIGVAVFPRHALTATELLDAADHALYSAKEAGRDTYVVADAALVDLWATVPTRTVHDQGGRPGGTTSP